MTWYNLSFFGILVDTSASQNIVVYLRGDKDLKMEISQTTIFNFLSKKNIKMHCTDPQGSLYIWTAQINSIPEIWPTWAILHITSLISLCNFFSVLDTSRFFHCWHVCFLFFIPLFFFLWSDIVAMISIGKIHITVLGIFMVSLLSVDCFWIALAC